MTIKNESGLATPPHSSHIKKKNSNPVEINPKCSCYESMSGNEGKNWEFWADWGCVFPDTDSEHPTHGPKHKPNCCSSSELQPNFKRIKK